MPSPDRRGETRFSTLAHLFLSDVRSEVPDKAAAQGANRPARRIGPTGKAFSLPTAILEPPQPPPASADPNIPSKALESLLPAVEETEPKVLKAIGVYAYHLKGQAEDALFHFARTQAGEGRCVAVLDLSTAAVQLHLFQQPNHPPPKVLPDFPEDTAVPFSRIRRQLESLDTELDDLLVAWTAPPPATDDTVGSFFDSRCVLVASDQRSLVDSYQVLKTVAPAGKGSELGVFVFDAKDFSAARKVHEKLAKTAQGFLDLGIENYGFPLIGDGLVEKTLVHETLDSNRRMWFAGLKNWLADRKSTAQAEEPTIQNETPAPGAESEDDLVLIDWVDYPVETSLPRHVIARREAGEATKQSHSSLAEVLVQKLFADAIILADSLTVFLRSAGLDCVRIQDRDGRGILVLVPPADRENSSTLWALAHYPHRDDRVILVASSGVGQMEKSTLEKVFPNLCLVPVLCGRFQGRPVLALNRKGLSAV